jgi:pyridoxamine 5'-phosphate oxidase
VGPDEDQDPIALFRELLERAAATEPADATAVALATADARGCPSVRMVLLKGVEDGAFLFFTNYGSRKARELEDNPRAALCFHWPVIGYQVRVEGGTERVSDAQADAYFATRPRETQLGAWTSRQSEPLVSRDELLARFVEIARRFGGQPVPRPDFWGGYALRAERIEIWQADDHRLHHRVCYRRGPAGWLRQALQP